MTRDKLMGTIAMCVYQLIFRGVKYDPMTATAWTFIRVTCERGMASYVIESYLTPLKVS